MDTHPSVLSLCAGIAGIDLGIRLARPGARTVCYVEREITVAQKLVARMQDGCLDPAPIWSDLKTFDGRPWRGRVDILTAGYPCQPFSIAGKQRGVEDPRHLWPHVARIIREVEPTVVFLENVENHVRIGFYEVARELRSMGYRVESGLFTAAEVGAPHQRRRLFTLGHAARLHETTCAAKKPRKKQPRGRSFDFPPGPDERDEWRALARSNQPVISRTSDGLSTSVDRLRALGNGVVPLVAALAYRTLERAHSENVTFAKAA